MFERAEERSRAAPPWGDATDQLNADSWEAVTSPKLSEATKTSEVAATGGYVPGAPNQQADAYLPDAKFDGTVLCKALRDEMERVHRQLRNPTDRQSFHTKWSTTCQTDTRTQSESGTDEINREMLASAGERFDYYFDRTSNEELHQEKNGAEIGIGIDTEIRGVNELRTPHPYAAHISSGHPLEIIDVAKGSPAEQAGLRVGDQILEVNGASTLGLKRRDVLAKITGETGADVSLKISRMDSQGAPGQLSFSAKEKYSNEETATYENIGDGVAHIKLRNFVADEVVNQMFNALGRSFKDKAIIIDLRNNNGGSVTKMEQIAEQILSEGDIYRLEQRNGDGMQVETRRVTDHQLLMDIDRKDRNDHLQLDRMSERIVPIDKPIVILVDEYSASAAEILTGILKVNKRATIVGMPTTGKSEGQQPVELPFNRSANLTDFEFYPGWQPVPHTGLQPDVLVARGLDPTKDDQLEVAKDVAIRLISANRSRD